MWTVRATLEWTQAHFEAKDVPSPRLSAQWLLCAATGLTRLELYTNYDLPLAGAQLEVLRAGIKRRIAGEPLQYILGKAPFRRLELAVRPGVLIPRPETEVLVDVVLDELRARGGGGPSELRARGGGGACVDGENSGQDGDSVRSAVGEARCVPAADEPQERRPPATSSAPEPAVLELGTGSGCIALSLLHECPNVCVIATDIDPAALGLAHENAQALGLDADGRLTLLEDDLAASLLADEARHGSFDVVVSNPPYIPTAALDDLPAEVADHEPRRALDGGADGLVCFRRIVAEAALLLAPGGLLACELHETTLDDAAALCQGQGYTDATILPDLTGSPRIITARAPAGLVS
ncbi:MAG: peptide chain release factor N(5)-glutamine methyltransferase [Coriobacteriales bacterium]|nr:peptide chain release factor N(5)-glutamine methyltransferase [Coriobacteriales bacterium]